jgi:hypothetical protein
LPATSAGKSLFCNAGSGRLGQSGTRQTDVCCRPGSSSVFLSCSPAERAPNTLS